VVPSPAPPFPADVVGRSRARARPPGSPNSNPCAKLEPRVPRLGDGSAVAGVPSWTRTEHRPSSAPTRDERRRARNIRHIHVSPRRRRRAGGLGMLGQTLAVLALAAAPGVVRGPAPHTAVAKATPVTVVATDFAFK